MRLYASNAFLACYLLVLAVIVPLQLAITIMLFLFINEDEATPDLMKDIAGSYSLAEVGVIAGILLVEVVLHVVMAVSLVAQRVMLSSRSKYLSFLPAAARRAGYVPIIDRYEFQYTR